MSKFSEIQEYKKNHTWDEVAEKFGYKDGRIANSSYHQWKGRQPKVTIRKGRTPSKPKRREVDQLSQDWIEESEHHPYTVYTLEVNEDKYVGFTGDLSARFFQHRFNGRFEGKEIKIVECEFYHLKFQAKDREKELTAWYHENKIHILNLQLTNFQVVNGVDQGDRWRPLPPKPGFIHYTSGSVLPTYTKILQTIQKDIGKDPLNKTLIHLLTRANGRSRALFVLFKQYIERLTNE